MQYADDRSFAYRDALNRGRIYDCGRVPPLPKKKGAYKKECGSNCFTLLSFLKGSHTNRRRDAFLESGWRRRIERGQISVDGVIVRDPDYILSKVKQQIQYHRLPWKEPILRVIAPDCGEEEESESFKLDEDSEAQNFDEEMLEILYIDNHILVVHKPSGLPTMPSQKYFDYTVLNALRRLYDEHSEKTPTNAFATKRAMYLIRYHCSEQPQPVHRLGVGTSGVLVVATSLLGRQKLTDAIRLKSNNRSNSSCDNKIRKVYRALVHSRRCDDRPGNGNGRSFDEDGFPCGRDGPIIPESFTIDCPIGLVPFPIGGDSIHAACPLHNDSIYSHVHTKWPLERSSNPDTEDNDSKSGKSKAKSTSKPALSHIRVICRKDLEGLSSGSDRISVEAAVVEVEIPTGRPHQIRIHMAYAGYSLVGDPLYLPGGIPNTVPRNFGSLKKEEEDMETDDENENEIETMKEKTKDPSKNNFTRRVALPRDCGYYLHAHTITLEHPCSEGFYSTNDSNAPVAKTMTFIAPPPPILREANAKTLNG